MLVSASVVEAQDQVSLADLVQRLPEAEISYTTPLKDPRVYAPQANFTLNGCMVNARLLTAYNLSPNNPQFKKHPAADMALTESFPIPEGQVDESFDLYPDSMAEILDQPIALEGLVTHPGNQVQNLAVTGDFSAIPQYSATRTLPGGEQQIIAGEFLAMKVPKNISARAFEGACATYNGQLVGVFSHARSTEDPRYQLFMISSKANFEHLFAD